MGGTLMRSRFDRKIAGVCGGIARNQGWDTNLVRLIWVALVFFAGTGVLAYVVLWIVLPEEPLVLPPYAGYPPPPPPQGYAAYPPPVQPGTYPPPAPGQYPGEQTYRGPAEPRSGPQNG